MLLPWVSGITDPGFVPLLHLVAKAQLPFSIVETLQPYQQLSIMGIPKNWMVDIFHGKSHAKMDDN